MNRYTLYCGIIWLHGKNDIGFRKKSVWVTSLIELKNAYRIFNTTSPSQSVFKVALDLCLCNYYICAIYSSVSVMVKSYLNIKILSSAI